MATRTTPCSVEHRTVSERPGLQIHCGTNSSNPLLSSSESANFRFLARCDSDPSHLLPGYSGKIPDWRGIRLKLGVPDRFDDPAPSRLQS